MSALRSARVVTRGLRSVPARSLTTTPSLLKAKVPQTSDPTPLTGTPQFPPPVNPFDPPTAPKSKPVYSETTKKVVTTVARVMGYNAPTTTAIRETGRMMRGVVEAVEAERSFWYGACALPATYQTFFQLHLIYVLLLVTRLRALRISSNPHSPVPESIEPGKPRDPPSHEHAAGGGKLSLHKPAHEAYPGELLNHFFELAESQMRIVLGRTERERVIRKYMDEMGEQWKGAGTGLDYILGLGLSENPDEVALADSELASWVWRNLFDSRGIAPANVVQPSDELAFIQQLNIVVRFVRRELSRLDSISDEDVLAGNIGEWGKVEQ